ncbi:hypothetical protein H5P36_05760 [Bacillus sp. APMAM]|uniref:hypothetical protein n=1 Tax=Margalitia sp. FSL K6-0131 TaxID=2954604 RepID=UPI000F8966AA|nr:hypothetical protein [Bacillus sp. APMAM]RTZ56907.1 hypothetical protein EKO25_05480 [Bacillus sp. SAJ1]
MFKYKINQKITEEVKGLVNEMFQFKILLFFEFVGFSLLFSFVTETLISPKPNFLLVFIPFLITVLLLYWITKSIRVKK